MVRDFIKNDQAEDLLDKNMIQFKNYVSRNVGAEIDSVTIDLENKIKSFQTNITKKINFELKKNESERDDKISREVSF